jgi:hypothetical protein
MHLPRKEPMYKGICYGVRGKLEKEAWEMSNHLMAMAWGILFCLPATVVLAFWYWHDTRKGK